MKSSPGQAVVFALLLAAVVITVGLAVVSQSIVDLRTATQSQEAVRAFTAAEAGIERILAQAVAQGGTVAAPSSLQGDVGNAQFNATLSHLGKGAAQFALPRSMASGDAQTLWLISHTATGALGCPCSKLSTGDFTVYWGTPGVTGSEIPALVLDIYYKSPAGGSDYSGVKVARLATDPANRSNNFSGTWQPGPFTILGQNFAYKAGVSLSSLGVPAASYQTSDGLQLVRARILYSTQPHPVAFDFGSGLTTGTDVGLPSQGFIPESQGTVGTSSSIKLRSIYSYPDLPPIFDYAIFGGAGDLKK